LISQATAQNLMNQSKVIKIKEPIFDFVTFWKKGLTIEHVAIKSLTSQRFRTSLTN
jgi:hypothetical protein